VASLAPAADTLAQDETVLDLAGLPPGGSRVATWRQRPIMAFHRSQAELETLRRLNPGPAETDISQMRIRAWHRALRADLGVFVLICTYDFAPLRPLERADEGAGHFTCPWCISRYDLAGRPHFGPARLALAVPPHRLRGTRLVIGASLPA
jgi:Rieske Fe-S protein